MENETANKATERYLVALEERVDELLNRYEQLIEENRSLQTKHQDLLNEREALIEQNEQSRARIETMVARLKGLEQST